VKDERLNGCGSKELELARRYKFQRSAHAIDHICTFTDHILHSQCICFAIRSRIKGQNSRSRERIVCSSWFREGHWIKRWVRSGLCVREAKELMSSYRIHHYLTEYGKFHYFLLAVCGFVSTSEEMDVISMSFILPSAQCDLKLDTQAKGWLNSIIFIGMMAGAYAWGSVADALGRRKVLIAISFMNALCIVASSFSQTYELFMLFRFLNGAA